MNGEKNLEQSPAGISKLMELSQALSAFLDGKIRLKGFATDVENFVQTPWSTGLSDYLKTRVREFASLAVRTAMGVGDLERLNEESRSLLDQIQQELVSLQGMEND